MSRKNISDVERELQQRHNPNLGGRFTSTTEELERADYIQELAVPKEARGRLPLTQERYVIQENPALVEWERYTRQFLRKLNTSDFSHRVTAAMVFEWVTNISIADLAKEEGADQRSPKGGGQLGSANMHLRHINKVLRTYFGTPYKTTIANRPVGRAYKVRQYFMVQHKKPMCLTLWPEWDAGVLEDG